MFVMPVSLLFCAPCSRDAQAYQQGHNPLFRAGSLCVLEVVHVLGMLTPNSAFCHAAMSPSPILPPAWLERQVCNLGSSPVSGLVVM